MEILNITYDDAIEAAKDVVNLIFKNREFCQVDRVVTDIEKLCTADSCFEDLDIFSNIKDNIFPIFSKLEAVAEYLFKGDNMSDADVVDMCDQIGEAYGSVMSYVIGFDERFFAKIQL